MKFLTFTFLITLTISSYGQNCKRVYEKVDKMTGKETKRADLMVNSWASTTDINQWLSLHRNDTNFMIIQDRIYKGEKNEYIKENAILTIKLNNDSLIVLKSSNTAKPTTKLVGSSIRSQYLIEYNCDKSVFDSIAKHGFSIFSYKPIDASNPETFELKKKYAEKTSDLAKCILM